MENKISKIAGKIFPVVAFAMSVYHLWQVMMPSIDPTKHMDIHLAFALSLVFLSAMIIKDDKHSGRTCLSQIASICFFHEFPLLVKFFTNYTILSKVKSVFT